MEVVNIRHAYRMSFFSTQKYFGNLWECIDCKFIPCYIMCVIWNNKGSENRAKDRYQVSVDQEISKKVKELASKQGRTPSNLIAYMVEYYFENNK